MEPTPQHAGDVFQKLGATLQHLVNPVNLFSGARQRDALVADNVVMFKRTSTAMLKPKGISHNYHHRFELVIPLVKAGRIHVDGAAYMLAPGQACLIFPHQFHHYLDIEDGAMKWLFVTFEMQQPQPLEGLRNSPRALGNKDAVFLQKFLTDHFAASPGAVRSFDLIFNTSLLLRTLLAARPADCVIAEDDGDPRGGILQQINRYVRANLHRPLALTDLAKHTGYSESHLRAVFRQEFGVSLGAYMRDSRLSAAAAMLSQDDHDSIESIAKACGFESIYVFSRAFKKAMGVSPSAYYQFVQAGGAASGNSSRRRKLK